MLLWLYKFDNQVYDICDFVEKYGVYKLFKKTYGYDIKKLEIDENDDIEHLDKIEQLLDKMDGHWTVIIENEEDGRAYNIFKVDIEKLKNIAVKLFPKNSLTEEFIAEIVADRV